MKKKNFWEETGKKRGVNPTRKASLKEAKAMYDNMPMDTTQTDLEDSQLKNKMMEGIAGLP